MDYIIHILVFVLIYGMAALSLDLVLGWAGLLNISQPVFLGIGAYSLALTTTRLHLPMIVGVLVGSGVTVLVATIVGFVLSKLKSEYYALGTLGLMTIFYGLITNLDRITRGPLGIGGIPRFGFGVESIPSQYQFFVIALIVLIACVLLFTKILRAPFGRILAALRDDEEVLGHFGYKTPRFKLFAFIIASVVTAVAGAFLASYLGYINPQLFTITDAIFLISVVVIGGMGSVSGALLGTLVLFLVPELLRFLGLPDESAGQIRQMLYGVFLVVSAISLPKGFFGRFKL
jgi:branched-chain amino acid transport system permease protein